MGGVVITGVGCVTPIGIGFEAFAENLRRGASGVGPLRLIDPQPYDCRVSAEVPDFKPHEFMPLRESRSSPRVVQFAVAAARLATIDARIRRWRDPTRVGVVLGSTAGPLGYSFEQCAIFIERGVRRIHPSFPAQAHNGVIASECAIQLDLHGPVLSLSTACTSSTDAIGLGKALIEAGQADALVVGGAEAPITPMLFAAFDRLGMMSARFNDRPESASRPFSADRDGFVLAEGAVALVLESAEHARARGARALAEVAGYGATCDARSHFSQDEGGVDADRAVEIALRSARVSTDDVDYVNAHGSATQQNDAFETALVRRVFGERAPRVPVSSSKSIFGHLLGASGAAEVAATIAGIRGGFLPPTINLENPDPALDLDFVPNRTREATIRTALSLSFGFGARNAALVLRDAGDLDE